MFRSGRSRGRDPDAGFRTLSPSQHLERIVAIATRATCPKFAAAHGIHANYEARQLGTVGRPHEALQAKTPPVLLLHGAEQSVDQSTAKYSQRRALQIGHPSFVRVDRLQAAVATYIPCVRLLLHLKFAEVGPLADRTGTDRALIFNNGETNNFVGLALVHLPARRGVREQQRYLVEVDGAS